MMTDTRQIRRWQISGFCALVVIGALLHFTYKWSGYNPIVGLFSPVNESVWEHYKLGFTALLLFSVVEYPFVKKLTGQYILAKAVGLLSLQIFITIFFYTYTAFTGDDVLFLDVLSFVLGSALCQLIAYRLMVDKHGLPKANVIGTIILSVHWILLAVFTFWPPRQPLFEDPTHNSYGTEWIVHPDERDLDHDH